MRFRRRVTHHKGTHRATHPRDILRITPPSTANRRRNNSNQAVVSDSWKDDQYWELSSFKGISSAKLKHLAAMGKLIRMKRKYVAATSTLSERRKFSIPERRDRVSARIDHDDIRFLAEFEIDLMLAKSMTPQEAAAAAAQAVAEAEAAMAEAEEAVRDADAEAAEAYAEAALQTLRRRKTHASCLMESGKRGSQLEPLSD